MHICLVYKNYPYHRNSSQDTGIGAHYRTLARKIGDTSHQVTVVTAKQFLQEPDSLIIGRVKFFLLKPLLKKHQVVSFFLHNIRLAWRLYTIHKKTPIDVIEFPNWQAEGVFFLKLINPWLKIPAVVGLYTPTYINAHLESNFSWRNYLFHYFEKISVNAADQLTTSTYAHWQLCQEIYSINHERVSIIPLGIETGNNLELLIPTISSSDSVNILYVGRTEKRKGLDILIKAIPMVISSYPKTTFTIVGTAEVNSVRRQLASLSLPESLRVHYTDYLNSNGGLIPAYRLADICVIPSLYESFGLTVVEAMSYGKPVIASAVGGITEIVDDGKDGILFEPGNSEDLSNAIIRLIKDLPLRKRLHAQALKKVQTKFSASEMAKLTLTLYEKITA